MGRKKNRSSIIVLLFFGLVIGGALYLYNSVMFERDAPEISMQNNGYWNMKTPLNIVINDQSGIKSYRVVLKTSNDETSLYSEQFITPQGLVNIKLESPRNAYAIKDKSVKIIIEAIDASRWNFFKGNSSTKEFSLYIDKKRPQLSTVAHSYKITKGGSALVIFKAVDDNLQDIFIQTNFGKKFKVQPFYKDGYYISLLAWPVREVSFKATIIARDYAGNTSKTYIPLYLKEKGYRVSNIKISDKFLKGKIAELAEEFEETQGVENSLEQFKIINEDVREKNEMLIHDITSFVSDEMISDFKMNTMYPLKNAQVVATFGDHRKYSYKGDYISESYHLGLDLASNAMAKIKPQNGGEVVYSDYNGIYGNMPVIHHGLGLYTLYGHCASVNINRGDEVVAKSYIANTGKSGYAMGDHLHFGVLIQGVEVRPAEWMDKTWIKLNITNVIKSAKEIINRG